MRTRNILVPLMVTVSIATGCAHTPDTKPATDKPDVHTTTTSPRRTPQTVTPSTSSTHTPTTSTHSDGINHKNPQDVSAAFGCGMYQHPSDETATQAAWRLKTLTTTALNKQLAASAITGYMPGEHITATLNTIKPFYPQGRTGQVTYYVWCDTIDYDSTNTQIGEQPAQQIIVTPVKQSDGEWLINTYTLTATYINPPINRPWITAHTQ